MWVKVRTGPCPPCVAVRVHFFRSVDDRKLVTPSPASSVSLYPCACRPHGVPTPNVVYRLSGIPTPLPFLIAFPIQEKPAHP